MDERGIVYNDKPPPQDAAASIASRSLAIYEAIGRRLAAGEPAR
ncbi:MULTISPECIES: hypothetical protein [Roseomonas]|nr:MULTISPECIES: hypothetical protein [Roseomonas]